MVYVQAYANEGREYNLRRLYFTKLWERGWYTV